MPDQVKCPTTEADGSPQEKVQGCGSTNLIFNTYEHLYDCLDCGIWFTPGYADPPHSQDEAVEYAKQKGIIT